MMMMMMMTDADEVDELALFENTTAQAVSLLAKQKCFPLRKCK